LKEKNSSKSTAVVQEYSSGATVKLSVCEVAKRFIQLLIKIKR
jgi:hypothetical protein